MRHKGHKSAKKRRKTFITIYVMFAMSFCFGGMASMLYASFGKLKHDQGVIVLAAGSIVAVVGLLLMMFGRKKKIDPRWSRQGRRRAAVIGAKAAKNVPPVTATTSEAKNRDWHWESTTAGRAYRRASRSTSLFGPAGAANGWNRPVLEDVELLLS